MTNPSPPPASEPGQAEHQDRGPRPPRNELLDLGRLRRSTDDRHIAGVGAGLARHLDIDPIIVRVTLVVLVFFGGAGLLLYVAGWLLVPEEGSPAQPIGLDDRNRGIVLLGVGILAALAALGDFAGAFWFPWPLVIVALLVVWWLNRSDRSHRPLGPSNAQVHAQTYAQTYGEPYGQAPAQAYATYPPYAPYQQTAYVRPRNLRKRGPILFWFTLAMIATGIGTLGLIDVSGAAVPSAAYPALGLALTGVMLVVGAFWGRAGGLILIGLLLALATLAASATAHHDAEQVVFAPTSSDSVRDSYDLGAGEMVIDMSGVEDVEGLDGREINVDAGLGELEIVVPDGVDVSVEASTAVGGVEMFGEDSGGVGGTREAFVDGGVDVPEMRLVIDLGLGQIIVREQ